MPVTDDGSKVSRGLRRPILSEGDVLGCVLFVGTEGELASSETDYKLAQTIAGSWAGTWNPDSNDDRGHPCSDAPIIPKRPHTGGPCRWQAPVRIHLTAQGHAAAGESVLLQHALQHLHVGGDIHGVVLEELVKLLLEALHHLVHHCLGSRA